MVRGLVAVVIICCVIPCHAFGPGPKQISVAALMRTMTKSELVKLIGEEYLIYQSRDDTLRDPSIFAGESFVQFAPIEIGGFRSALTVSYNDNKMGRVTIDLPLPDSEQIERGPLFLFSKLKSSATDFQKLRMNLEKELGQPSEVSEKKIGTAITFSFGDKGPWCIATRKDSSISLMLLPKE
jgi:hypothetical protein